jgi:hypothetical protein
VPHPVLDELDQPSVLDGTEEVTDVCVEHPAHLLPQDADRERIQRLMLAAPTSNPVGETEEVRLVDGVQHLDDGA